MNIAPKKISLSLLFLLTTVTAFAIPAPPPPLTPPPPGLPIDSSIVLLIFVAIVYGFYTLKKFKIQSK